MNILPEFWLKKPLEPLIKKDTFWCVICDSEISKDESAYGYEDVSKDIKGWAHKRCVISDISTRKYRENEELWERGFFKPKLEKIPVHPFNPSCNCGDCMRVMQSMGADIFDARHPRGLVDRPYGLEDDEGMVHELNCLGAYCTCRPPFPEKSEIVRTERFRDRVLMHDKESEDDSADLGAGEPELRYVCVGDCFGCGYPIRGYEKEIFDKSIAVAPKDHLMPIRWYHGVNCINNIEDMIKVDYIERHDPPTMQEIKDGRDKRYKDFDESKFCWEKDDMSVPKECVVCGGYFGTTLPHKGPSNVCSSCWMDHERGRPSSILIMSVDTFKYNEAEAKEE